MIAAEDILKARILVVDDQNANVLLLEKMLAGAGYTAVTSTMDPLAVCALHQLDPYDLILLDLQMPVMDGFQVMDALHKIESNRYLPVLVITAQPGHKLRALGAGAKDFVSKPFDLAEVRARVHNMLEVRLLVRELEKSRESERRNSERELAMAQETQESLLPRVLPQFENFHVRAFNHPTRYVGGDFYDFRKLSPTEWVGVLADVSGKGMFAALLSSMVLGALNMEFRSAARPADLLQRVNRLLCEKSLPSQFVTLFLFVLNPAGMGEFVSAGHNPAYLFRSSTGQIEELVSGSSVLGIFDSFTFSSNEFHLCTGDLLVVYTDGLTDAENLEDELFGEERLLRIIQECGPAGSVALEQALLEAVREFTQGTPQTDDITFLIVEKYQ